MEPDTAPIRTAGAVQDSGIRRNSALRLGVHSVCAHGDVPVAQLGHSRSSDPDLHRDTNRAPRQHAADSKEVQVGSSGRPASLSTPSWGGQSRLPHIEQGHPGCAAEGTVEEPKQCSTVSKRRPNLSASAQSPKGRVKAMPARRAKHRKNIPLPALGLTRPLVMRVFLEIFSGCGRLASAVARYSNWPVLIWDIQLGEDYDLRRYSNRRKIADWIRGGHILGFHLGTPCESFTRARDVPPGPPPLRSDQCPMGLPNLSAKDQLKVWQGNLFMRFSAFLLRLALSLKVPGTLENPQRSRLWLCRPIAVLVRKRNFQLAVTHFCAWGTPWKKATSFLGVWINLDRVDAARCHASKRGICAFSHNHHGQLCGQDAAGNRMTKLAQPYPVRLCNSLARCFYDANVQSVATQFSAYVRPDDRP